MGWNYGYKNLGGLCNTGEIFGAYTDVSQYNLRYDPFYDSDRFRPITKGVAGNDGLGGKLGGLNLGDFRNLQDQTNYVVYRIDVVSDDDIRREIVLKGQYRQQYTDFVCKLYLRVYSDATTYTDTEFTAYNAGSMVTGWYPSGGFNEVTQAVYAVFTTIQHDNVRYMLVGLCNEYKVPWQQDQIKYAISCIGIPVDVFTTWLDGGGVEPVEESPEFGPASGPDGYGQDGAPGTHDKHSDHVGIPTKPQYGFTSAGFLNHYRISAQGLSMLGEALFPEPSGVSVDVAAAIDKLITTTWNSRIIDYIIDCRIIPVIAPATNMEDITCGGKKLIHPSSLLPYSAYLVDEDFVDVDCGVIRTPLTEGNFVDFITRAKVFIPFYGFVDLAPEYWHGAKIGLYYRFNLMDGSFMAWLTSAPFRSELESAGDMEIIGQYAGNACIHLPINSQSYSQIIGGMITTGAAIVGAAAGGAIGGAVGGKAGAAAVRSAEIGMTQSAISGAADIASGRPQLINNNSYNGSAALMSCRTPYLLIEFAETQFSTKYVEENGLPAIINRVLGTMSGFTTCVNPIIDFACEQEEAEEIRNLLRSGVIL